MIDWSDVVRLPTLETSDQLRRKTTRERLDPLPRDDHTAVLAMALVAARAADVDVVTVPVFDAEGWTAVTLELDPLPSTATLRESLVAQMGTDRVRSSPPPRGCWAVALGDVIVDSSHLVLRRRDGAIELEGPVEPIGAVPLLARRIAWMAGELGAGRSLQEIGPCDPIEAEGLDQLRSGAEISPFRLAIERIEAQALRSPHAPAVTTPWVTWSYDDLIGHAADRYAMLRRSGVDRGDVVGVHLSRSADLVAVLLALWQVGAVVVPLRGDHPQRRVQHVLDSAGASAVLTDQGGWRAPSEANTLTVDRSVRERRLGRRRDPGPALDDAAYVIFTSGTTGRPKGIEVTHANLAHYFGAASRAMPRSGWPAVMLATTPITFDPSLLELIWPLTEGWEVVVDPGRDIPIGPVVRRRQVTHLNGTPTMASLMLHDRDGREVLATVRHLLLGGEPVRAELVRELAKVTRADVTVCYGPTECTVDVTWGAADPTIEQGVLPIGRPLPGHRVDVVDRRGRSCGAFTLGELVVCGDAVASGYVGREDQGGFGARDGEPAYRTGDRVWSDPAGTLHFAGRRDAQVKIRGHRIELAEVDGRLLAHDEVGAAASVVVGEGDARRIESFVVGDVVADDLIDWVSTSLPEPMVPARIHVLDELPRSASDKTDLTALARLAERRAGEVGRRRPLSPTEERIATMFESILGLATVPPDRTLFELGGNSVSAVRLVSELEDLAGERVALTTLLDLGTVERLAAAVTDGSIGLSGETLVTIVDGDFGLPVYCVAGADGHAVNLRPLGEALGRPFHALEFAGTDGITPPDPTIDAMAERFTDAVATHRGPRPAIIAGYSGGGIVALEMARRLRRAGTTPALVVLLDTMNPSLERRTATRKVIDGIRELTAPDDVGPLRVLRSRLAANSLSRDENLFAVIRKGRVPNVVDLTPDFEQALATWEPSPYDGPVLVVRSASVVPAYRGWERVVTGPLDAISVDAGHVRMMLPPAVDELAARLRDEIEAVEADHLA